jgi:hypothetical protein
MTAGGRRSRCGRRDIAALGGIAALAAMLMAGCASMTVVDTKPLPESRFEPPGSESISAGGYRLGAVRTARCARGRIVDGTACDDGQAALIHISLIDMPDGPDKSALLAIPTGLTLRPHDVDLLVAAAETSVITSEPLRHFLNDYPARPPDAAPRQARAVLRQNWEAKR